jgi:hypothetical protein
VSGLLYFARLPPPGYSFAGIGVRILAGQFSSTQAAISVRKLSKEPLADDIYISFSI